jgi:UDP-N-acetylglucosamine transferase subunit ALG13
VIFVTVGSAEKGMEFDRLVREMDRIAGVLGVDVLIQRGTLDYEPCHSRHIRFAKFDEALDLFRQADLVVGHCGAGTTMNAVRFRKPLVLVPRRAARGEHSDDHQMELAALFGRACGIRIVEDIHRLEETIREMLAHPEERSEPGPRRREFVEAVAEFLADPLRKPAV